jgi:thiamine-phosphate pyrophosphorylase
VSQPRRNSADALRLVAVTDSLRGGIDGLARRAAAAVEGGATMLTLRLPGESARTMAEAARALQSAAPQVPLLVSDRVDVALAVGAAGVHVGSSDLPAAAVRRFAPEGWIIGASEGSADEVPCAADEDFVAIGTDGFAELAQACRLPAVAVGGVTTSNATSLMACGAAGVAVISALFGADDPMQAARALRSALDATGR